MANPVDELLGFTPYSWVPKDWETNPPGTAAPALPPLVEEAVALEAAPPIPPPPEPAMYAPPPVEEPVPLQPGTGLPQSSLAGVQPEIEMPPEYVGQGTPEVDAISGVDAEPPPVPEEAAEPVEQTPSGFFNPVDFSSWGNDPSLNDLRELAANDPMAFARHVQTLEGITAKNMQGEQAKVEAENTQRREQEVKDLMETQTKANAIRDRVMNAKIDTGRWWASRSVPQKVASYIAVIVGGLMQGRRGGPNQALQMIDAEIDRDIAEQSANLDKDRSMIAQLRADGMSDFQAKQTIRSAWYNAAIADIQTRRQDFEPGGTTDARMVMAEREFMGRLQAAANAAGKDAFEQELKVREDARKEAKLYAELRKANLDYAKEAGKLGGGSGGGSTSSPVKPGNLTAAEAQAKLPPGADKLRDIPGGYTPSHVDKLVTLYSKSEAERRKTKALYVDGVSTADGAPYEFPDEAEAKSFRGRKAALAELNALIGDLDRDIKANGGEAAWSRSGASARYKSRTAQIGNRLRKLFDMGTLDEGAMKVMKDMQGGIDPGAYWGDPTVGLETLREDLIRGFNLELDSMPGYDGPGFRPPNTTRAPVKSAEKDAVAELLGWQTRQDAFGKDAEVIKSLPGVDPALVPQIQRGYSDAQKSFADEQAKLAATGNVDARQRLEAIRDRALSPGYKAYAAKLLGPAAPKPGTNTPGRSTDLTGVKFE